MTDDEIRPFRVEVPNDQLADLKRRLEAVRWPDELPGGDAAYGIPLDRVRQLVTAWRDTYDWRAAERRFNSFPQFTTTIDGQNVYFLHVRSPEPGAVPLLLTHGWPGSVAEFLAVIGPLTDPAAHGGQAGDAFDVVIPAIPGFGFSGPTTEPGWDTERVARAWATLMARLGYERYGAQGGDWGSYIGRLLARVDAGHLIGLHVNFTVTPPDRDPATWDDETRAAVDKLARYRKDLSGYSKQQSTRPQTLAYGLSDSPAGLLAWIAEKFAEWSAPDSTIPDDDLLTTVMLYWLTNTAASSARLYWEAAHGSDRRPMERSEVPVGVAVFPDDMDAPIRALAERLDNVVHWTVQPRGGHFAALEQPDLFVDDVRAFFRGLRTV